MQSNQQINNKHDEGVAKKPRPYTQYIKLLLGIMWRNHLFKHMGIAWEKFGKNITHPHSQKKEDGIGFKVPMIMLHKTLLNPSMSHNSSQDIYLQE